jgi:hypothetical protein
VHDVRSQLDRMRRGWSRTRGRDLAGRAHLWLLLLALAGAIGSRTLGPWPGYASLEREILPSLAVAAFLLLLAPLLARLVAPWFRPSRARLARRLDDAQGWRDATDTALALGVEAAEAPLGSFLSQQTSGRLRELDERRLWPARQGSVWIRRLLVLAFLFVLLAPGVDGLLGIRGPGRGDEAALGNRPETEGRERARPLEADEWLLYFVEEPMRVEALAPRTATGSGR